MVGKLNVEKAKRFAHDSLLRDGDIRSAKVCPEAYEPALVGYVVFIKTPKVALGDDDFGIWQSEGATLSGRSQREVLQFGFVFAGHGRERLTRDGSSPWLVEIAARQVAPMRGQALGPEASAEVARRVVGQV